MHAPSPQRVVKYARDSGCLCVLLVEIYIYMHVVCVWIYVYICMPPHRSASSNIRAIVDAFAF